MVNKRSATLSPYITQRAPPRSSTGFEHRLHADPSKLRSDQTSLTPSTTPSTPPSPPGVGKEACAS